MLANRSSDKKFKYLMIGILLVFDHLVWKNHGKLAHERNLAPKIIHDLVG
jgi:hypothetical protein